MKIGYKQLKIFNVSVDILSTVAGDFHMGTARAGKC
jgi:hypothetical protein